jgi:hypothetical protein
VCACMRVITTFKVCTVEDNHQLQKEFENRCSESSGLFDTVTVDIAVLKCSIVIDQCIVRSYEYLSP